ncbi:ATP-binding protein [Actinomadura sp. 9N215]|uniref:ATP-binding protein n=1 Tax=Actinomadura sp. 9N215 TaxID=3375150 RepID=UPI003792A7D2
MQSGLVLCLPRDVETVQLTRGVLDASLKVLGVTAETRDDITLALGEACANVVQHADPADVYELRVGGA